MITDHCCHCAGVDLTGAGWKWPCLCRSSAGIAHRAPATGDQSTVTPATRDTRGMQTRARVRLPRLLWHKLQKRLLNVVHTRYIWKPRILTSHSITPSFSPAQHYEIQIQIQRPGDPWSWNSQHCPGYRPLWTSVLCSAVDT